MFEQYVKTAARFPDLLRAIEEYIARKPDGANITFAELSGADSRRLASRDEVLAIVAALTEVGVLLARNSGLVVNALRLVETQDYRTGVTDAISRGCTRPPVLSALCVAIPPEFDSAIRNRMYAIAIDLRSALLDVIASAESRLVLASPFWDAETLGELTPLLERRMDSGVTVTALGRFRPQELVSLNPYLGNLSRNPNFRAVSWFNVGNGIVSTFHFKAVIADGGRKAYLGSANLTTSGLRSRLEVGSIWSDHTAYDLAALVDTVISVGTTVGSTGWNA